MRMRRNALPADAQVWARRVAVAALVACVLVVMLMTSAQMSGLRAALPPLSHAMSWLEGLPLPLDMDHVVFFALVATALRILLPKARWGQLLLVLAVLAMGTELLQFGTVGRTPNLQDVRDDLIGGGIGLLLGAPLAWLCSQRRLRRDGKAASIAGMTADAYEAAAMHAVLAGWLVQRGGCTLAQAVQDYGVDTVLAACEREGVVSLVHARLSDMAASIPVPPALMQPLAARARTCAARSLLCLSEARKIQQALDAAEIPAIWLKGIALGQWLYPRAHLRDIADIDLLLPDHATTLRAAQVLAPLGYALPNPHIAGDLVVHELLAWSERARLELDLHWDVSNGALFADRLPWQALVAEAIPLPGLGAGARGLSPRHALLHACLHRAVNMLTGRQDRLRWLYDIHLLVCALDEADWTGLVEAATDAGLCDATLGGLQAVQGVFGTALSSPACRSLERTAVHESIRTARLGRWGYFQRACWRRLPDLRTRFRWLRQLMIPDLAHLRVRYGGDGAGTVRLMGRRVLDGWRRWRGYAAR